MEAKDTVMNTALEAVWDFEKFKLDQAEISFKAGIEEGIDSMIKPFADHGEIWYREGKADGMRKVVEWIEEMSHTDYGSPSEGDYWCFSKKAWQAFLKENGL